MATAIEFNNISKIYRLGMVGTGTLAHDLKRWWTMNVRGKEDPYLTIGETNDRSTNGAGKSTLLKILSKVTAPTTGTIRARGRIGSLLEVGTGFHPEMTGRENIYMNGAILGMTKAEITKKLDEIVDFSGCERYIDTPVKRYSSGMMVRLGFAVAAHLDPEILVVDEVLAVGDAEFQKKAIGKMQDVSRGEGRTVLFVSHNMAAVRNLCRTGVILQNGSVIFSGTADMAIENYLKSDNLEESIIDNIKKTHPRLNIKNIKINGTSSSFSTLNPTHGYLDVLIEGEAEKITNADATLIFRNNDGAALARFSFSDKRGLLNLDGHFCLSAKMQLPQNMHAGRLKIDIAIHQPNVEFYLVARECCVLDIEGYVPKTGQLQPLSSGLLSLAEE